MRPRCTVPRRPHGNFAAAETFAFSRRFKRSSVSLYVWTPGASCAHTPPHKVWNFLFYFIFFFCTNHRDAPRQRANYETSDTFPTAARFPCFTAGRGSDDRLGQNEACDFPCSGEAVISRLSVSFVKLPWALSSRAALQVDRTCFIKRHQKVRPSEISQRRAQRSPAFCFRVTPLLQRSAVSVSLMQAQIEFIKSDAVKVKRGKSEAEKIKRHSGRSRHRRRFGASQKAWFISANPCSECAAVMHCDNKFGCFMLYLTTFSFVTHFKGYWGCFHLLITCLLAHSNANAHNNRRLKQCLQFKVPVFHLLLNTRGHFSISVYFAIQMWAMAIILYLGNMRNGKKKKIIVYNCRNYNMSPTKWCSLCLLCKIHTCPLSIPITVSYFWAEMTVLLF